MGLACVVVAANGWRIQEAANWSSESRGLTSSSSNDPRTVLASTLFAHYPAGIANRFAGRSFSVKRNTPSTPLQIPKSRSKKLRRVLEMSLDEFWASDAEVPSNAAAEDFSERP